ncbi:MAG: transposase [Thermoplasmata archaeon]|nr:transposase [Thermoplasmata archaeon]
MGSTTRPSSWRSTRWDRSRCSPTAGTAGRGRATPTASERRTRERSGSATLGMYDYHHHKLRGYLSPRKTGSDWVRFLRYVRSRYPSPEPIFLIMDNLSARTTPGALEEAERLRIRFVPIPTNPSRLNPIETHFRSIRRIALSGTHHRDLRELGRAVQ